MEVATFTVCLNKEVVQHISHTQIVLEHCCLVKTSCALWYRTYEEGMLSSVRLTLIEVKLCHIGIEVYRIAVLLLVSVEVQILWLAAEYRIDGLKRDIRNAMLDLNGLLSIAPRRQTSYPNCLNGSYRHVTFLESRNRVFCKKTNICTKSSMTFTTLLSASRLQQHVLSTLETMAWGI